MLRRILRQGSVTLAILSVADQTHDSRGYGHHFVDDAADGGNEEIVDKDEGTGQKQALAKVVGIEITHGQGVQSQTYHEEQAVVALPEEHAHDRHDQSQQNGQGNIDDLVLALHGVAEVTDDTDEIEPQSGGTAQHGVSNAGDYGGRREGDHDGATGTHLVGEEGNEYGNYADDLSDDFNGLHSRPFPFT